MFLGQVSFETLAKYQDLNASLHTDYATMPVFREQLTAATIRLQEVRRSHARFAISHEQATIHFRHKDDQEVREIVLWSLLLIAG